MLQTRPVPVLLGAAFMSLGTTVVNSQDFPSKTIRIVAGAAGGGGDFAARIVVPGKTPALVIKRLNQEIVRALNQPDVKEKFLKAGVEVVGSTPEQFAAVIKSESASFAKVIKDAGIKL